MNSNHLDISRKWLDRSLEATWLLAIVLVPLIALPSSDFITLIGLPKTIAMRIIASVAVMLWLGHGVAWLTERALFEHPAPAVACNGSRSSLPGFMNGGRLIWAVAVFGIATAISTVFSIELSVSVWGRRAAYEGYGLYSTLSLLALFLTVAFKLRSKAQLWRLFGVITAVGVLSALIGIAQNFDAWFVRDRIYSNRASGHSGNPIAFGALLLFLFPVAVVTTTRWGRRQIATWRLWAALFVVNFIFVYAIGLTLSRGPYLGLAAVLVAMPLLMAVAGKRGFAARLAGIGFTSALLVAALLALADHGLIGTSDLVHDPESVGPDDNIAGRVTDEKSVNSRLQIWEASGELILERPSAPDSSGFDSGVLRHLFGYGPDQYRYVMGLTADAGAFKTTTNEAHNDVLNRLVEIGWIGTLAFLSIIVISALALIALLRRSKASGDFTLALVAAALLAAFGGRMVEQQFGIVRNSDSLIFWVLLGVVAALPRQYFPVEIPEKSTKLQRRAKVSLPSLPAPGIATGYVLAMTVAVVGLFAMVGFTWQKNINYLFADHEVRMARNFSVIDPAQALEHYEAASDLAPDVAKYKVELGDYYAALADSTTVQSERLSFLNENFALDEKAVQINRFERDSNFQLAESAWRLALAGDAEKLQVAIDRYRFVTELAPNYALAHERLKQLEDISVSVAN